MYFSVSVSGRTEGLGWIYLHGPQLAAIRTGVDQSGLSSEVLSQGVSEGMCRVGAHHQGLETRIGQSHGPGGSGSGLAHLEVQRGVRCFAK